MRNLVIACVSIASLAACGKKSPEPATTAPAATTPTEADVAPPAALDVTAAAPEVAAPEEAAAGDDVLVWSIGDHGYTTAWLAADGSELATRPEVVIADASDLWAIQERWTPFEEVACDTEDEVPSTPKHGAKKFYPSLAAKALGVAKADKAILSEYKGDLGEAAAGDGVATYLGEHWGKTISLNGGYDGLLFVSWCDGGYGCGAHGNTDCMFEVSTFGRETSIDLTEIDKELAPTVKAAHDLWRTEMEDEGDAAIELAELTVRTGDPIAVDYLFAAGVSYAGTDGNWSSYTQAKTTEAPPAAAMHLPTLPSALKKWLAAQPKGKVFGWSVLPASRRASLDAFKDATTLAPPEPKTAAAPVPADGGDKPATSTDAKLAEARKATKEKRYSDAIAAFDGLITEAPTVARAWSGRGYAKLLSDDLAGAKADFDKALTLESAPKFQAAVYFNLGELALRQKDAAAAQSAFTKADSLAPSAAAKKQLERLK